MIIRFARTFGWACLALGAWALVMLALPLVGPAGRQVAVLGPDAVHSIVAAGGQVVERRRGAVLARGGPGFARRLYAAGAPLVLEGRAAGGCFSRAGA